MKRLFVLICIAFATPCFAQKLALGVNVLDAVNLGTINGQLSYAVSQHWSLNLQGRYNNWSFGSMEKGTIIQNRSRGAAVGVRYWTWNTYSGWWFGASARWDEYNRGGWFKKLETEEGDAFGGGLAGGFAHMLSKHWNIDFGLGVWAGMTKYVTYMCPRCGKLIDEGKKFFVLPSPDCQVSFVYVF